MRPLIFIIFKNLPLIFNRHFKFLCWGSKSVQIFYLFQTLFEAALNLFKLLYLCSEIILTLNAFFWLAIGFPAFSSIIALFASWAWKLLQFLCICRSWTQLEENSLLNFCSGPKYSSSCNIQDTNRANLNTFWAASKKVLKKMENLSSFWASAEEI